MNVRHEPESPGRGLSDGTSRFPASILVGRGQEQLCLRDELVAAASGHGRIVLIGGEAGIGKTALARELSREAQARGIRILAGQCYERVNAPPYGPWLDLFTRYTADPSLPEPPVSFAEGRLTRVISQSALFDDTRRFMAELVRHGPVLILLEDLHWSDPSSIELLRHLGAYLNQWPLLALATYRADELSRHHAFYQQLPALMREANGLSLQPRRLDSDAFRELINLRYLLSRDDSSRLVAYLDLHTDGNPFFAIELLRALEEEGMIGVSPEMTTLGRLDHVVVPSLLRQVIDGRVARLGEDTRQPLEIAAVIGQEVPLELWARLAQLNDDDLLSIVDRAVAGHLLEAERQGRHVLFVHALTREALYEGILPPRRRSWHRRVGEVLATDDAADPEAVALHFQLAGDPRAVHWLVEAADQAQGAYAWLAAAERLRSALTLIKGEPGQELTYGKFVFRVANLMRFSQPHDSILALNEVELLASRIGDRILLAEAQLMRGHHRCYMDQFQDGLKEILNGLSLLEAMSPDIERISATIHSWFPDTKSIATPEALAEDSVVANRLHASGLDFRRSLYVWHSAAAWQPAEAVVMGERLVTILPKALEERGGLGVGLAFTDHGLGIAYAAMGKPDEARRAWQECRELFRGVDHFALIAFSLFGELRDVALTYGAANPAERRRLAAEAEIELARAGGALRPGVSPTLVWLGCLILDGEWDRVDRVLQDLPSPGVAYLRREVTTAIATLARQRGEPNLAWNQISILLPEGPETQPGNIIHQEGLFLQCLACELCLDNDDANAARQWLEAHDRWLDWSGAVLGRADGRLAWARWHLAAGDTLQARHSAHEAREMIPDPGLPLVQLGIERLLGEIDTAEGNFALAEAHLLTAVELANICEAPFERTLTFLALAHMHASRGDADAALAALDHVRRFCERANAVVVLARADALQASILANQDASDLPGGLTQREMDVLRLLAQFQTDKEIAETLFISRHTASTHVKHILGKLAVANRREAADYAHSLGLNDTAT